MTPETYDHLRPADADVPDGVYRVVGAGDRVALLRVGDADGRRINTGEVLTVDRAALEGFEPADNPDGTRSPGATLRSVASAAYWSVRAFATSLVAHPLPAAGALALVAAGSVGEGMLPDPLPPVLIVAGTLALAYVGGGRL